MKPGRDLWWHELTAKEIDRVPVRADRCRGPALHALHVGHDRQAQGHRARPRRVRGRHPLDPEVRVRHQAERHLLVRGRLGWVTGHSYIVYAPLMTGATQFMYEGAPDYPGPGPLVEDHRSREGDDSLHFAHRHPDVHALRRRVPEQARPVLAAPAGFGRRADQPGGVALVPQEHRRRASCRSWTPGGRPRPARS